PAALVGALKMVVQALIEDVIQPVCSPGLPRVMVLLDASSSMLNVGNKAGPMGQTGWDQARDALSGNNSLFDQVVFGNQKVENLVHLGLAVFGHNAPAEEKILVDYGPCMKDNFAWALDPWTSCEAPGCTDPWAGPPIQWTFKTSPPAIPQGAADPFDQTTRSHMPQCSNLDPNLCTGSGTYVHLGLNMIQNNINAYKAACADPMYPYPCDQNTKFINILVTDGNYNSTNMQVQTPLQAMYDEGIITYVIGFGDGISQQLLANMANWGSGGTQTHFDANNQADLEAALAQIIEGITFDPCCAFNNCAITPEPTTNEPDPLPGEPDPMPGTTTDTTGTTTDATASDSDSVTATDSDGTDSATDSGVSATDSTSDTSGPTTGSEPTSTTTGPTSESDSDSSPEPTTTATTNTTNTTQGGVNTSGDTDTDTEGGATTGTPGAGDPEGCGCVVDEEGQTRGLLASLVTFGLAGFIRRRRRA
ncbi:MAG TPA: VWA domain-containing protein, partial [Nannocystis sp.]